MHRDRRVSSALSGGGTHVVQSVTAPPPGNYRAVVLEGATGIDPYWVMQLRRGSNLRAQPWVVGCFDGDSGEQALAQIQWQDARHLVMIAESGRRFTVLARPPRRPDTKPGRHLLITAVAPCRSLSVSHLEGDQHAGLG